MPFPDFYRSHAPGLVAFVMWPGAGAEEAADVAQETMTRAWQNWEQIRAKVIAEWRRQCGESCSHEPIPAVRARRRTSSGCR